LRGVVRRRPQHPRLNSEHRFALFHEPELHPKEAPVMDGHFHLSDQPFAPLPEISRDVTRRRFVLVKMIELVMRSLDRARGRRTLGLLDDRMLRDIGLDRGAAQYEIDKPFWR
jgi:uncharacterized protein YjiS (DUF1127 family)